MKLFYGPIIILSLMLLPSMAMAEEKDAIDVEKFKNNGNWILNSREISPKCPFINNLGQLKYLDTLPEDFEVIFSWIEKGAENSKSFAGGMALYSNTSDFINKTYSDAIECSFSNFFLRIHIKESEKPIFKDSECRFTTLGPFANFLKKPGQINTGKIIYSRNKIQTVINGMLIFHIDLDKEIENGEKAKFTIKEMQEDHDCLIGALRNIRSGKKNGLKMNIYWHNINANENSIITKLKVNEFKDKQNGGLININEVNQETKWCANENGWSLESDKYYKKLAKFAKDNSEAKEKYNYFGLNHFGCINDMGATNNNFVIERLVFRQFYGENKNYAKARTFFIAMIKDKYSTYVSVTKYDDKNSCEENKDLLKNFCAKILPGYIGETVIETRENYLIQIINMSDEETSGFGDYAKNIVKIFD